MSFESRRGHKTFKTKTLSTIADILNQKLSPKGPFYLLLDLQMS